MKNFLVFTQRRLVQVSRAGLLLLTFLFCFGNYVYAGVKPLSKGVLAGKAINTSLSNLMISSGALSPSFVNTTTGYTASVTNATTEITVTPTLTAPGCTITVNGAAVASATASTPVLLNAGPNTVNIVVKAPDGITTTTYTVIVTRVSILPVISYINPPAYTAGITISSLKPVSNDVGRPGYGPHIPFNLWLNGPTGVAVDLSGNVYVGNLSTKTINEIFADGHVTTIASGVSVTGVAVDASGNVYAAIPGETVIKKYPAGSSTPVSLGSGFLQPFGVALDQAGNVYVSDQGHHVIKKIPVGGGAPVTIGSGFGKPYGITVDARGNVYIIDGSGTNEVKEIPAGTSTPVVAASGFAYSQCLAADDAGNVYVSEGAGNDVLMIPAGGGTPVKVKTSAFLGPLAIAVDAARSLYVYDGQVNAVVKIKLIGGYYIKPSLPAGLSLDKVTGIITGTPTVASPATNYEVRSYNDDGYSSATVNIRVLSSSTPGLDYLHLSSGTLSPIFAGGISSYSANVPTDTTSIAVIPFMANLLEKITVNGTAVTPNNATGPVLLAEGPNVIPIKVTSQDGTATKTYTLTVTRAPLTTLTNAHLSDLQLSSGALSPAFSSAVTGYAATVSNSTTSITLTPTTSAANATVTVNGAAVGSGIATVNIPLTVGRNAITTIVKSPDGSNSRTYTVIVTRLSSDANLARLAISNIILSPVFSPAITTYTAVQINSGQPTVDVTPTVSDAMATVSVNGITVASGVAWGPIYFYYGTLNITVTAQDGSKKTYTITIPTKQEVTAALASLVTSTGTLSPVFSSNSYITSYTVVVPNTLTSINVTPTAVDPAATITVNGVPVASGTASADLPIHVGANLITITVTARTGRFNYTYTLNVSRLSIPPTVSYSGPQTYTAGVNITPLTPTGGRVFPPAYAKSPIVLATGFKRPTGVTVDAAGNLFVADYDNSAVEKIPQGGGAPVTIGSGFLKPYSVAVDLVGNVYVCDQGDNSVKKIPVGGGVPVVIGSGFNKPAGIAVDTAGNVYVADEGNNLLKKIPAGGGPIVQVGAKFNGPFCVAVDIFGNIYVTEWDGHAIIKILSGGGIIILPNFLWDPTALTVDALGNLYVSVAFSDKITKVPVDGSAPISIGSAGFTWGIAAGAGGRVYFADQWGHCVSEIKPVGGYYVGFLFPAGLSLNSTTGIISGAATTASPATNYTITGYNNAGNSSAVVNIKVLPSNNADLSSLQLSSGILSPAFASNTTSYIATVSTDVTSVTEMPVAVNTQAKVKVNGALVPFGTSSVDIPLVVGANVIKTVITSQDKTATKTYTVTINRPALTASNNARLSALQLSSGVLSPVFTADTKSYSAIVSNSTASITVTPTAAVASAALKINGLVVKSGKASANVPLTVGANIITIVVTSQDGTSICTYTIMVTRPSSDATLAHLLLSKGTLSPVFSKNITSYTTSVHYSTSSITLTSGTEDSTSTVKVNGAAVKSGGASASIPLSVGSNIITVVVTAQDQVNTKTYTVAVTRLPSNVAKLIILRVNNCSLSPRFSPLVTDYTATVNNSVTGTMMKLYSWYSSALTLNGTPESSGVGSAFIPLAEGPNVMTIVVTAMDGVTTRTYTVTITRLPLTNADLSGLRASNCTLSPGFNEAVTSYTAFVGNSETSVIITPKASNHLATITVNGAIVTSGTQSGNITLAVGLNTIPVVVMSQDGITTKSYTIYIIRAPSADADLANFRASNCVLSPAFKSSTISYTALVSSLPEKVIITPKTSNPTATVKVNGVSLIPGAISATIPLNFGPNTITVEVTAQDGVTVKTYTLTITRTPLPGDYLSSISLMPHAALTVVDGPDYRDYTASVSNATTSVREIPVTGNPTSVITVNGDVVLSGSESAPITLNAGSNTITTVITAQDEVSIHTYVINITRAAAPLNSFYQPISVSSPTGMPQLTGDELNVHAALSPNGDGINDFLLINGITNYPDNKLQIMNRSGQLIFEAKGYDNSTKVFDGHSSKTGAMQLPGTYFYSLDYTVNGVTGHKRGYIVLKY